MLVTWHVSYRIMTLHNVKRLRDSTCQKFWIHSAGILSLFVARIEYIEVVRAKFPARSSSVVAALCSNSSSQWGQNFFKSHRNLKTNRFHNMISLSLGSKLQTLWSDNDGAVRNQPKTSKKPTTTGFWSNIQISCISSPK